MSAALTIRINFCRITSFVHDAKSTNVNATRLPFDVLVLVWTGTGFTLVPKSDPEVAVLNFFQLSGAVIGALKHITSQSLVCRHGQYRLHLMSFLFHQTTTPTHFHFHPSQTT